MHRLHQSISDAATAPTILPPGSDSPSEHEHQRWRKEQEYLSPNGRQISAPSLILNSSSNVPLSSTHSFPGDQQNSCNSSSDHFTSGNHDTLPLPNGGNPFHNSSETPYFAYSRLGPAAEQQSTNFTARDNHVTTNDIPLQFASGHSDYASVVTSHSAARVTGPIGQQPFNQWLIPSTPTNTDMTNAPTLSSETSPQISNATGPVWSVNGGEPMIRDGSRFSRSSMFSCLPTPVLRSPAGDGSMREGRTLTEACQPTIAPASLGYEVNMSQQPTFTGFSTQLSNNYRLGVPLARSSSALSGISASVSASASNTRLPVSQDAHATAIRHRYSDASGSMAISPSQSSYTRPSHEKVTCLSCKATFKGDHELRRHELRQHSDRRVVWVTKESSPDGTFLAGCKACANEKRYKVDYNAAAHLRRMHFHPRERKENGKDTANSMGSAGGVKSDRSKNRKGSDKKRGGKAGGNDPPMSVLKNYWMREVVEYVPQETANMEEEEDDAEGSTRSTVASDDGWNGFRVGGNSAFGAGGADANGSNADVIGNSKKERRNKRKSANTSKDKGKGKSKAVGKGASKSKSSISHSNKSTNGCSHSNAQNKSNGSGNRNGQCNQHRDLANQMRSINDFYNEPSNDSVQQLQVPVVSSTTSSSTNLTTNDNPDSMLDWTDIGNFDFDNSEIPSHMTQDHEEEQIQIQEQPIGSWSISATAGGQMSQPHTNLSVDSIASRAASASAAAFMSASMPASMLDAATAGMLYDAANPANVAPSASSQSAIQLVGAGLSQEELFSEVEGADWV